MFEFSHFCLPSLILGVLSVFWILAILVGSDISLCFDLHFSNDEHLFKCSLAISISLVICLFSLSPICKLNHLPYSPLSLHVGYLFLLCSNIFLSVVVQQLVMILVFSQEKMHAHPSTPPGSTLYELKRFLIFLKVV